MTGTSTYYDRTRGRAGDGTPTNYTAADADAEVEIARLCEQAWDCNLRRFGKLAPVDWYAERHERVVGVAEFKARSHAIDRHETVWLNVRKWLALTLAGIGMGVPPIFVVKFTDAVRWIDVRTLDARQVRVAGCRQMVKAISDIEPVIEVLVSDMTALPGEVAA